MISILSSVLFLCSFLAYSHTLDRPGWWVARETDIARDLSLSVEDSLKLIYGVSITVFDAGVTSYEMKVCVKYEMYVLWRVVCPGSVYSVTKPL